MSQLTSNKRIAKNTLMLYIRMLVNMAIGLYTSRVVLQTLGVSDYGVYGVVGGIVSMFGFLSSSMSGATSRFLSFELGKGNIQKLKEIFSSALILHIAIALFVILICETFGLWFLENKLTIPEGRMMAARWVMQFSIVTMFFQVVRIPFYAAIISRERMEVYAYAEISNSLLNLVIVYLLSIGRADKLILYSTLTFSVAAIITFFYICYGLKYIEECSLRLRWKKDVVKTMLSYTGWQFYGNFSLMIITQGINMLMNVFFGTVMNAAYEISNRVKAIVMNLATNFTTAIRPQIVKSYSASDYERTYFLMCNSMRISFVLMLAICGPLMLEAKYILELWLGVVPEHTVTLLRLALMWNVIVSVTTGYGDVMNATGDVKLSGLLAGTLYIITFPVTYIAFKMGVSFWFPFAFNILTAMLAPLYTCIPIKKHLPGFSWTKHVFSELSRCYCIMIVVLCLAYGVMTLLDESFMRLVITTFITIILSCSLGFFVLFPKDIRTKTIDFIKSRINKR